MRVRFLAAMAVVLAGMSACTARTPPVDKELRPPGAGPISVVASAYPLAFASQQVGAGLAGVTNLAASGAEPHDIELTPGDIQAMAAAQLVVYVGGGFQPAVERAVASMPPNGPMTLDVLSGLGPINIDSSSGTVGSPDTTVDENRREMDSRNEIDMHETADPHMWLDPAGMGAIGSGIADRLSDIDPDDAGRYGEQYAAFKMRLDQLDRDYLSGLRHCARRTIIVTHSAYTYLADRYGLAQISLTGISSHSEATPAKMAAAETAAVETGSTTVFTEPRAGSGPAETLARELGISTAVLDPIEVQFEGEDYFAAMQKNLAALRKALNCD